MKLAELVIWYETLTPATIPDLSKIYHEDAHFRDPFNDVCGQEAVAAVFRHMFEATTNPVFRITGTQTEQNVAWVSWTFDCRLRGKNLTIDGVTRLYFGADGRVIDHRDFWDATDLFEEFALVGTLLRFLKRRLRVPRRRMRKTQGSL